MGLIMGSQKIMGSDYGSNISVVLQVSYSNFRIVIWINIDHLMGWTVSGK
jgi:hypothetical protein